jgi:hypothetical protein
VRGIVRALCAFAAWSSLCAVARADPSPAPVPTVSAAAAAPDSPAASAEPTASARPLGLHQSTHAEVTLLDQGTRGPGQVGPEAGGFASGSPLAPNTPYDLFSSAPLTPGVAGIGEILTTATYGLRNFDASVVAGLGEVRGSSTLGAYWGESLMATLNPHQGSLAYPYRIVFPTHAGQDDATAFRTSILSGSVASADGNVRVKAGYFDLTQTDRFVFAQPALTSANPAIAFAPAESLGNGVAGLADWSPDATSLQLQGLDVVAKRGDATLELSDAGLPSLPGSSARQIMGSLVLDRGEGTRFSAQLEGVTTAGTPFVTTIPSGTDPTYTLTPQGMLPSSTLSGQRQTIAGLRAAFHFSPHYALDGVVEIGRAWYSATDAIMAGTNAPGGFYHAGLVKVQGRVTASIDYYRMDPRYATIILPYGIPENQWSAAFAWPGQWLKSNYQLIDNSVLGVNRQGYRIRYYVDRGPLEVHLEYTDLHQLEPETRVTAEQEGFVDGYYLPQLPGFATFGQQKRYAGWLAWHPAIGDVTLDIVDDTLFRPFDPGHVEDRVSYEVPQAVVAFARHISPSVVASIGLGRYAMKGAFAEPIDYSERTFLAGFEVKQTRHSTILISFRRSNFGGLSTEPVARISPDFGSSLLTIEQRVDL